MNDLEQSQHERFQQYLASQGIRLVSCSRCRLRMQVRLVPGNQDARLLKRSETPEGWCVDCAMTDFLKNQSRLGELIEKRGVNGLKMLLDTRVQHQIAGLLRIGNADAKPGEINWERVIEHWELPFLLTNENKNRETRESYSHGANDQNV